MHHYLINRKNSSGTGKIPRTRRVFSLHFYGKNVIIMKKSKEKGESMLEVNIYTDGSARGNPGPGGYGAVLLFTDGKGQCHRRELSGGFKRTTNNRMELLAAITALEALIRPCQVELYSDSQYLVKAFNEHWIDGWQKKNWQKNKKEPVKNVDMWKRLLKAMEPHRVEFHWVKGHAGHPENERCDQLAVEAAMGEDLPDDPGLLVERGR